jgi:hypothetical protein
MLSGLYTGCSNEVYVGCDAVVQAGCVSLGGNVTPYGTLTVSGLARDLKYLQPAKSDDLLAAADELGRVLNESVS